MSDKKTTWILWLKEHVTGPLDRITRQATAAEGQVAKLVMQQERLEQRAGVLQGRLGKLALGVGVFAALSVGSLQFEESMARTNTMAGLSQKEFAGLTEQIQDLSEHIPIARKELSEGLYEVISAGVPKDNWISFLEQSAKTAKGGQAELGTVVGATAGIIKNYGMAWEDVQSIQDKFQKTVKLGQIPGMEALASVLPRVAGRAATLGISVDEMLGSLSTLAGVSGNVSESSSQMGQVFQNLIKPTAEATELARKMGVRFDSLAVKEADGLSNFLTNLTNKVDQFAKRTGQNTTTLYGQLFGSAEAIQAIIPLVGKSAKAFQDNTAKMANSAGAVEAAYRTMSDTTLAKIQLMRNAFGGFMDQIVGALAPVVTTIFTATAAVLSFGTSIFDQLPGVSQWIILIGAGLTALTAMSWIIQLATIRMKIFRIQLLLARTGGLAFVKTMWAGVAATAKFGWSLLATVVKGLGSFILGLVSATAAQIGLNVAMTANPIGVIIVGIGALIAGIVLLIKHWDWIKEKIIQFGKWLIKNNPFYLLVQLIGKIFPGFREALSDLLDWVIGTLGAIGAKLKGWWNDLKAFFGFGGADDGIGKAMADVAAKQAISLGEMLDRFAGMQHAQQVAMVDRMNKQWRMNMTVEQWLNYREMYKQGKAPGQPGFEGGTGGSLDGGGGNTKTELVQGEGIKSINMELKIENHFDGDDREWAERVKEVVTTAIVTAGREASLTLAR